MAPLGGDSEIILGKNRSADRGKTHAMAVEIKKTLLGKYLVVYECSNCKERLRSKKEDIGNQDICPTCQTKYRVPGAKELEAVLRREQDEIDRKNKLAADKAAEKEAQRAAKDVKKAKEERAKKAAQALDNAEEEKLGFAKMDQLAQRLAVQQRGPAQSITPTSHTGTRRCPFCAEEIQASAIKCKHCGEFLDGRQQQSPAIVVQPVKQGMSGCGLAFVIACGIIAAVFFLALL